MKKKKEKENTYKQNEYMNDKIILLFTLQIIFSD